MPFEEIVYLAIDQVVVGPGHRPLGPLDQLVASMGAQGLINPVTVTPGFRLVAGRHRYEAARKLGWGHIPVIVRDLDEVEAILVRIDENLVRNDLTVLERAEALAKRKELYTAAQQGDWGEDRQLGYSATTAQALGVDQRTIQRYLQIAGLDEEVKASLAGHPLADSVADLTALSRLDPLHQAEVVSSVLAGEANTARDAIARLAEPPRPLGGQRWSVLAGELPETLPRPFLPLHPDGVAFLISRGPCLMDHLDWAARASLSMVDCLALISNDDGQRSFRPVLVLAKGIPPMAGAPPPILARTGADASELVAEAAETACPGLARATAFSHFERDGWDHWLPEPSQAGC